MCIADVNCLFRQLLYWSGSLTLQEYLNNLPIGQREAARKGEVWKSVQNHFHPDETRYAAIEREVLPFVLPAIDQPVIQASESKKIND